MLDMLSNKDYCDYDTCVALMELGYYYISHYNWRSKDDYLPATAYWSEDMIPMIHLYDAQKWLRDEKRIYVMLETPWKTDDGLGWSYICCNKPLTEEDQEVCFASGGFFDSYEEALLEGIKEAIKLLKEERK